MTKLLSVFIWLLCIGCSMNDNPVSIKEIEYLGRAHFVIATPGAVYYYDKAGGGFSRVLDEDKTDWVAFAPDTLASYPAAAATAYRGLPNFVFGSPDNGAGHPGFNKCVSIKLNDHQIRTTSHSGKWQWLWNFDEKYAFVEVEKADPDHAYWFLYEGPIAGKFNPFVQYWGTDQGGPNHQTPDYYDDKKISGNWRWCYFGDTRVNRILFVAQKQQDQFSDILAYLGNTEQGIRSKNGMMVFGFGRKSPAIPQMKATGNKFYMGFYESKVTDKTDHKRVSKYIQMIINNGE